jgi:large subunit ribosomal protein L31
MKKTIHPTWYTDTVVTCACGNSFTTGSTSQSMQVDICSKCHPFFTGEMRFVDRQGRVDKFMQRMQAAQVKQTQQQAKAKKDSQPTGPVKSYQEILRDQQSRLKAQKQASKVA